MSRGLSPGERYARRAFVALMTAWVFIALGLATVHVNAQGVHGTAAAVHKPAFRVPERCRIYQRQLTAEAHTVMGLDAPIGTLAGQIYQESTCNPAARSPVGAAGLTQFMPLTAADLAKLYPRELGPADALNPRWAMAAQVRYMRDLQRARDRRDGAPLPECVAWWFGLRDYNGGGGWTERERRLARAAGADANSPAVVARFNAGRSAANHRENTEYPARIVLRWGPEFAAAGFGRNVCEGIIP